MISSFLYDGYERLQLVLTRQASLDSVTYLQFKGGVSTVLHVHRDLLHVTVTEAGTALCVVGQTRYQLTAGTAVFIYPNEVHSFTADERDPYLCFTVKIRMDAVLPPGLPRLVDVGKAWAQLCKPLLRMYELSLASPSIVNALLTQAALLEALAEIFRVPRDRVLVEPPSSVSPEFERTLAILQAPPFIFPGLERLAEINRMSRRSFTDHFKKVTGLSPRAFQVAARMNHAEKVLATGASSVKETATQCGYSKPQNFIRAYRRYFGMSPGRRSSGGLSGSGRDAIW